MLCIYLEGTSNPIISVGSYFIRLKSYRHQIDLILSFSHASILYLTHCCCHQRRQQTNKSSSIKNHAKVVNKRIGKHFASIIFEGLKTNAIGILITMQSIYAE